MTDPNQKQMVSREEFETHRQQVVHDIEGLAAAIKAESEARSRDTRDIRSDIKDLAHNVGSVSTTVGRPQYQALAFSFGIFSTVWLALAGLYAFMDDQNREILSTLGIERASHQVSLVDANNKYFKSKTDEIQRRLMLLETKGLVKKKTE
jgi:hypothetical protein